MFDYVRDAGLKFNGALTKRKKTDLILLHHVEGRMGVSAINDMHKKNGHKGIDYNFYIGMDGEVWNGRGLEYEGGSVSNSYSKTKGMNARAVAIVCDGNFNNYNMPDAQFNALCKLVGDICSYYGLSADNILSHREAAGSNYTDCPGTYFPTEKVRNYVRNMGGSNMYVTTKKTPVYMQPEKRASIGAGHELELQAYPPVMYALVRNPDTGNEFFVEWDSLKKA